MARVALEEQKLKLSYDKKDLLLKLIDAVSIFGGFTPQQRPNFVAMGDSIKLETPATMLPWINYGVVDQAGCIATSFDEIVEKRLRVSEQSEDVALLIALLIPRVRLHCTSNGNPIGKSEADRLVYDTHVVYSSNIVAWRMRTGMAT